jgi:hypothetical protein
VEITRNLLVQTAHHAGRGWVFASGSGFPEEISETGGFAVAGSRQRRRQRCPARAPEPRFCGAGA